MRWRYLRRRVFMRAGFALFRLLVWNERLRFHLSDRHFPFTHRVSRRNRLDEAKEQALSEELPGIAWDRAQALRSHDNWNVE